MGYLDNEGLKHLWEKVKERSPVVRPLTQAEYDALPESEKQSDTLFVITDKPPLTPDSADERYLKLSGGTMSGNVSFSPGAKIVFNHKGENGSYALPISTSSYFVTEVDDDGSMTEDRGSCIEFAVPVAIINCLSMRDTPIMAVGDPEVGSDATNKRYVDSKVAEYLPLSGGEMAGDIKLKGNKLTSSPPS